MAFFLWRSLTNADIQRNIQDFLVDLFTPRFGELLAVINPWQHRFLGHDNTGSDNISSQRATPHLIDTCNHAYKLAIVIHQHLHMG